MTQPKSIMIDGVRVIWNGYTIEYGLPAGFGGRELEAFVEANAKEIKSFRKLCEA